VSCYRVNITCTTRLLLWYKNSVTAPDNSGTQISYYFWNQKRQTLQGQIMKRSWYIERHYWVLFVDTHTNTQKKMSAGFYSKIVISQKQSCTAEHCTESSVYLEVPPHHSYRRTNIPPPLPGH